MKNRNPKKAEESREKFNGSKSISMKGKKKNMRRLGGGGLSLEAFANAKSTSKHYNPALIKKQREFYKNAKYVSKFKKRLKQENQDACLSTTARLPEDESETGEGSNIIKKERENKKHKNSSYSLGALYERKHEEEEKARSEREAIIKAKKEERDKAEARRKAVREKMFKKNQYGQPVMKYRIEHLLQTIQGSN